MTATPKATNLKAYAEGKSDLFKIDPRKITIRQGWNSRDFTTPENIAHVAQLAGSIREVGVREPLAGYMDDGEFILTNGESRLRAVLALLEEGVEIKTVPVIPEPRHASEADHIASQIVRNSGRPFTPMENARVFARLNDLGWSPQDIAAKTGMTSERVGQIMKLNSVPESVKDHVKAGQITPTTVQRIQQRAASAAEIEETVAETIRNAQADGKAKATPRHIPAADDEGEPSPKKKAAPKGKTKAKVPDYRALFLELMEGITTTEKTKGRNTSATVLVKTAAFTKMVKAAGMEDRL